MPPEIRGRAHTRATYTRPAVATEVDACRLNAWQGTHKRQLIAAQLDVHCMECVAGYAQEASCSYRLEAVQPQMPAILMPSSDFEHGVRTSHFFKAYHCLVLLHVRVLVFSWFFRPLLHETCIMF